MKQLSVALLAAAALAAVGTVRADTLLLSYTSPVDGQGRTAEADFYVTGSGKLRIDLFNLADPSTVHDQTAALTGLFFNLSGSPTLTFNSATALRSVTSIDSTTGVPTLTAGPDNYASFWGSAINTAAGYHYGLGAAGNPGGSSNPGFGTAFDGVTNIDGSDGGVLPSLGSATHYDGTPGNNIVDGLTSHVPYAYSKVTFVFDLPGSYTLTASSLGSSAMFGYGTASNEGSGSGTPPGSGPPPVPLPAAAWSGMALLAGMGLVAKMRKRN